MNTKPTYKMAFSIFIIACGVFFMFAGTFQLYTGLLKDEPKEKKITRFWDDPDYKELNKEILKLENEIRPIREKWSALVQASNTMTTNEIKYNFNDLYDKANVLQDEMKPLNDSLQVLYTARTKITDGYSGGIVLTDVDSVTINK